jgi:hypothetical protein
MRVQQHLYRNGTFTNNSQGEALEHNCPQLVLAFGGKELLETDNIYTRLREIYPLAEIITCSTSGEIYGEQVYDNSVSAVAIEFEKTGFAVEKINITDYINSYDAGTALFKKLNQQDLSYFLVIADGALLNGSELVRGIESSNSKHIPVTGGLAGDSDKFNYTLVGCNDEPNRGNIVGIGFYGNDLKIAHGSLGGWDMFGPEKTVTRSLANKLYEIDNRSAIEIYKQYLGRYADELPGSALLFPLSVKLEESGNVLVRTILSIDYADGCMVFAGDLPEGSQVRFMKANFDKIIDAATNAAAQTLTKLDANNEKPKLALLISCVGRKLILGKRIDEETEAVAELFGSNTIMTGFYSYGEISPLNPGAKCELHNQTMTITTFDEA